MEIADPMSRYLGWVRYSPLNLLLNSTICFRYGTIGYSFADLVKIDQNMIEKHHLEHLVELKHVDEDQTPQFPVDLAEEVEEWAPFENDEIED
jgi:hypothetical protein